MRNAYLLLHFSVILAGFTGVFGKLISLNEGMIAWYRVFFSAIILFFVVKLFRINTNIKRKEKFDIGKIGLFITLDWVFFYASIKYSNISVGVVCYCLSSFFTALLKPLILKTNFKINELIFSSMTLLGIMLIFHFDSTYQTGILLGIIAPIFAALYTIYNERLIQIYDSKLINYYQMIGGLIGLSILLPFYLYFFPNTMLIPDMNDTFWLVLLALFCTVGLYVSFTKVLKHISAFTVNLSFTLEPLYGIILAFLFFEESKDVYFSFYAGLFCIVTSLLFQTVFAINQKQKS
jgi:drug/metabolite transporter (DMT)-like permease